MNFKIKLSKKIIITLFLLLTFIFYIYINRECNLLEGLTDNEAGINLNFNKVVDIKEHKKEIVDLENNLDDLDNQIKELKKKEDDIIRKRGIDIAKNVFGTPANLVSAGKPVSDSIKHHFKRMSRPDPLRSSSGNELGSSGNELGSSGNNSRTKCLSNHECQTRPFYKGNYIPTGNSLYGPCPCIETEPHVFGASQACCPVITSN